MQYRFSCILFFFITAAIAHAQPTTPPQFIHNYSTERPKAKFKLSGRKYLKRIDCTKIDTNAIYISHASYTIGTDDSNYVFMRFFKDAVFESGTYLRPPTDEEAEDLTYGSWRCYTFDKKTGMLVIEVPMPFMMSSSWVYYLGVVSDNSLTFKHARGSYPQYHSAPSSFHRIFFKRSVAFKNYTHTWAYSSKEKK